MVQGSDISLVFRIYNKLEITGKACSVVTKEKEIVIPNEKIVHAYSEKYNCTIIQVFIEKGLTSDLLISNKIELSSQPRGIQAWAQLKIILSDGNVKNTKIKPFFIEPLFVGLK